MCSAQSFLLSFLTPHEQWSVVILVLPSLVIAFSYSIMSLSWVLCLTLLEGGGCVPCSLAAAAAAANSSPVGGLKSLSRLYASVAVVLAVVDTTPFTASSFTLRQSAMNLACWRCEQISNIPSLKLGWGNVAPTKWCKPLWTITIGMSFKSSPVSLTFGKITLASSASLSWEVFWWFVGCTTAHGICWGKIYFEKMSNR